jgi:hypothetical protein
VVANGVLFIATGNTLYAISEGASLKGTTGAAK